MLSVSICGLPDRHSDKAGATTQKYIGDALMGVWDHGPDAPSADAIRPPLACALRLFDIAADLQKRFGMDIAVKIGVGMNTGLAVLGNLGSRAASDYTALGDTINKPSAWSPLRRMCSATW